METTRELKFRAWHKTLKIWLTWQALTVKANEGIWAFVGGGHVKFWDDEELIKCQFTGLLDKNKKEVFEGDILKGKEVTFEKDRICRLIWCKGEFLLVGVVVKDNMSWCSGISDMMGMSESLVGHEVIGNIYENPEFLAVEKGGV